MKDVVLVLNSTVSRGVSLQKMGVVVAVETLVFPPTLIAFTLCSSSSSNESEVASSAVALATLLRLL